ncbi:MAG: N-acyl homoserine lactonase family protein [Actinomycetota bacterium]
MTSPDAVVRLHAFSTGSMTTALGGFLEGEQGDITFPVPVYVIEHPSGLTIVDTGLHPDLATSDERLQRLRNSFSAHLPDDGSGSVKPLLAAHGFDVHEVRNVILTHLHFDHTGGLCEVPNATVVVQADEWAGRQNADGRPTPGYFADEFDLGHDRLEVDGDHDLFGDGSVIMLRTDGHTAGHQSVRVRTETGTFLLCGDCCYLRRTLDDEHLPPFAFDRDRQLASIRRVADEERSGTTLIFGHDPDQWPEIEGIVA